MAHLHRTSRLFQILLYLSCLSCCLASLVSVNKELDESNWKEILEGEWMVEFYAPWCPACTALAPAWKDLSMRASRKLQTKTAAVDVTKSPGLSGRFVVSALPTIYHVKDGEFRKYKGPRDVDSMFSFVEQKRWQQTDPIPGWKAPNSIQMTLVAEFFKMSQELRNLHNMLMETYGLPTWGSYLIFALGTIFIGTLLGLFLVCLIDLLYPPRRADKLPPRDARARGDHDGGKSDDDQELINDDIVDDEEHVENSDAEKNSPSDSSSDEAAVGERGEGGQPTGGQAGGHAGGHPAAGGREVRKRRPRKAD